MKKFCSNCGNQLELSQRACGQCGEVNPFFVAAFTILSDQTDALEKLRLEKEKIEKELQEKIQAQLEFERQQQLKREQEESEKLRLQQLEAAKREAERLERERIEELIRSEKEKIEKELEEKLQTQLRIEREHQLKREQEDADKNRAKEEDAARREVERIEALVNLEKAKMAKELKLKLEAQLEIELKQRVEAEREDAEKLRLQKFAADQIIAEQDKKDAALQNEILQVKENNQQYQRQTIELVNEVREELQQIEVENNRLKQEVAHLHSIIPNKADAAVQAMSNSPVNDVDERFERKALTAIISFVFLVGAGLLLFYIINWQTNRSVSAIKIPVKSVPAVVESIDDVPKEYIPAVNPEKNINTTPDLTAIAQPVEVDKPIESKSGKASEKETLIEPSKTSSGGSKISAQMVVKDMVGQKVSGCDIVIKSEDEISGVSSLKLIEKLPSGQMKYKFSAVIKQNNQTYKTSPYVYYHSNGTFVKLDGTNCE